MIILSYCIILIMIVNIAATLLRLQRIHRRPVFNFREKSMNDVAKSLKDFGFTIACGYAAPSLIFSCFAICVSLYTINLDREIKSDHAKSKAQWDLIFSNLNKEQEEHYRDLEERIDNVFNN